MELVPLSDFNNFSKLTIMKNIFCFLFFTIIFLGSCNNNTDSENKNESDSTSSSNQDNKKEFDTIPRAAAVKMIKHFRDTAIVSHKFSKLIHMVRFNTEDLKNFLQVQIQLSCLWLQIPIRTNTQL